MWNNIHRVLRSTKKGYLNGNASLNKKIQNCEPVSLSLRSFKTRSTDDAHTHTHPEFPEEKKPGSVAFADVETDAMTDLFNSFAQTDCDDLPSLASTGKSSAPNYLTLRGVRQLLASIGERPDEDTLRQIFQAADTTKNGKLSIDEFLTASDIVLGGAPARIVIVVGGPGSGKGILCDRLAQECGVVHLSSGELLREEVARGTPLGKECQSIMERGELVSSAVITTLIRRHTRSFPGQRVLLDGFPRSVENAYDFLELMGKPELALHLDCDDTILMERIMKRGEEAKATGSSRADDNFETALKRLRTFHKYHHPTMNWLREQHVPVVNLDCSGTPENVWNQLLAIGRLMRPAAHLRGGNSNVSGTVNGKVGERKTVAESNDASDISIMFRKDEESGTSANGANVERGGGIS